VQPYVRRRIKLPPHFPSCDTSKGAGARRFQIVLKGHGELDGLSSGTWTAMRHVLMADTQQNNEAKQRVGDLETRMTAVIKWRSQAECYLRTTHSGQGTERGERDNILQIVESRKKETGATALDQVGWWVHMSVLVTASRRRHVVAQRKQTTNRPSLVMESTLNVSNSEGSCREDGGRCVSTDTVTKM